MSNKGLELLIDERNGRLHCAVVRKTSMIDLFMDSDDTTIAAWGSIYVGRVAKIDRALDAAIIELGDGLMGFLPAKHAQPVAKNSAVRKKPIGEALSPGQSIIVQVKSEPKRGTRHEQLKLPRLTSKIVIMGQYSHHTPLSNAVLMSRKIASPEVIDLVTEMKKGDAGFLVQATADLAPTVGEIKAEAVELAKIWQHYKAQIESGSEKPRLIARGPHALARAMFDYSAGAFERIYVADKNILKLMQDWCAIHAPALATSKRLRLFKPEKLGQKLFDFYDVEGAIADLNETQVFTPVGGGIIIDYTHAMVVVDVNQGSAPSILDANIEAAREVARQMRLRNLSGAIVVDFINMTQRTERAAVLEALEKALANDTASPLVHGFTRIGIVEITRKRRTAMHIEKRITAAADAAPAFNKNA